MARNKGVGSKGGGSDKKELDEKLIHDLALIGCTYIEIAHIVGCQKDLLTKRYKEIIQDGHTNMKMSLRRKQLAVALEGNTQMLIWLGKNNLKQAEKQELTVDGQLKQDITVSFVDNDSEED